MDLHGRTILVTGAGRRVGRAIALALGRAAQSDGGGSRIAVHYNSSQDGADAVVREIESLGCTAHAFGADMLDPKAPARLVRDVVDHFGGLDVLVNSAAVMERTTIQSVTVDEWERIMTINLRGPFFLALECAKAIRLSAGQGCIVNIGDLAAFETWPEYVVHGISKGGIATMTKSFAKLLAPDIRVNSVAPGAVLLPEDYPENEARKVEASTPLRRLGSPDDVAEAVLFLLRADYVTGETVFVDGGRSIRY